MQKFLEIIPIVIANHLVLGSLVALIVLAIIRVHPFNAATRHGFWLGALCLVVMMPFLVLVPNTSIEVSSPVSTELSEQVNPSSLGSATGSIIPDASDTARRLAAETIPELPIAEAPLPENGANLISNGLAVNANDKFALQILSSLLAVFLLFGINLNMLRFIRAYLNVKRLFAESSYVDDSLMTRCCILAQRLELNRIPVVKHSDSISSALTGGILHPTILIPTNIYQSNTNWQSSDSRIEQVLLHELAHIKRRDPLIALGQSLVSAFFFWHPMVHFINRHIRFERELASDDWVVSFTNSGNNNRLLDSHNAKDYASNLITIAESMTGANPISQTVSCVSSSRGLTSRIETLLNREIDHSIVSNRSVNLIMLVVISIVLFASSPLWPRIGTSFAVTSAGQIVADSPTGAIEEFLAVASTENAINIHFERTAEEPIETDLLGNLQNTATERPEPISVEVPKVSFIAREVSSFSYLSDSNRIISETLSASDALELSSLSEEIALRSVSQPFYQQESSEKQEFVGTQPTDQISNSATADQHEALTRPATDRPIEEVVVIAPATLISVYFRLQRAEEDLYELFNDQNSEDRFDIVCEVRSTDHFLFKEQQFCEPAFLDNYRQLNLAEVEEARQNAGNVVKSFFSVLTGPRRVSDRTLRRTAAEEMEQVQQEIINLASTNTEFAAQLYAVSQLQTELENKIEEAEDQFGDIPRGAFWGNGKASQMPGTREYRGWVNIMLR